MSSKPRREGGESERRARQSVSPSKNSTDGATKNRHRSAAAGGEREKRRTRRPRPASASRSSHQPVEMGWTRGSSPSRGNTTSRTDVANRQLKQLPVGEIDKQLSKDAMMHEESVRSHRTSETSGSGGLTSVIKDKQNLEHFSSERDSKGKKGISTAAASSRDIDEVIAQFRNHCDEHMATLLELKNSITTTEKVVVQNTEKDKEFVQVRKWYSALVEKHTKLQKEHQALQEEHLALQEKYMNLKQASKLQDSLTNLNTAGIPKRNSKKDKKGLGEIVWQRAGNTIKNKLHSHPHQQLQ